MAFLKEKKPKLKKTQEFYDISIPIYLYDGEGLTLVTEITGSMLFSQTICSNSSIILCSIGGELYQIDKETKEVKEVKLENLGGVSRFIYLSDDDILYCLVKDWDKNSIIKYDMNSQEKTEIYAVDFNEQAINNAQIVME